MPSFRGCRERRCLRARARERPRIHGRFVLISEDGAPLGDHAAERAGLPLLSKPFTSSELDAVLDEIGALTRRRLPRRSASVGTASDIISKVHARARVVIVGAARTPIGRYGGCVPERAPGGARCGCGAASDRTGRHRAVRHRRGADRPRPPGGLGTEPGPAGRTPRRRFPPRRPRRRSTRPARRACRRSPSGAQSILLGESDVVLAGGIESMSRMPYLVDADDARWGHKMGNFTLVDAMYRDGFICPLCGMIMGETAEVLAREYGITPRSVRCLRAREPAAGRGARSPPDDSRDEIAPVTVTDAKGKSADADRRDEHPRPGTTIEALRKLPLGASRPSRARPASSRRARRPGSPTAALPWSC